MEVSNNKVTKGNNKFWTVYTKKNIGVGPVRIYYRKGGWVKEYNIMRTGYGMHTGMLRMTCPLPPPPHRKEKTTTNKCGLYKRSRRLYADALIHRTEAQKKGNAMDRAPA